jgi:hypothetical protein
LAKASSPVASAGFSMPFATADVRGCGGLNLRLVYGVALTFIDFI